MDGSSAGSGDRPRSASLPFVVTLACAVVAIAGFKLAGSLLIPIVVAAFVAIVLVPGVRALERWGVPGWLAVVLVLVLVLGAILATGVVVGNQILSFRSDLPAYQQRVSELGDAAVTWLEEHGVELAPAQEREKLDPSRLLSIARSAASTVADAFSSVLLVLLIVVFMLAEASGMPRKVMRALGRPDGDVTQFQEVGRQVWAYLALKTMLSLLTGLCFGVFLAVFGVDYPVLWGLLAFLLNFIPNIGSLLAAIPPVLLALVQPGLEDQGLVAMESGLGAAALVGAGNLVINQVLGNVVEPKVMGKRLGLSPLVVLLSLVFWSWLWGPVGMLLSVPLTQVAKILFEHFETTRPIAILLGPNEAPAQEA